MHRKYSIGVFDSGFGGLAILKHIVKALPQYDYVYLGDTARTPYGTRSKDVVYKFTEQAVDFLFKNNCWLVIIACNTASADALRKIQQEYLPKKFAPRRALGVLIPAAEEASRASKNKKIGVMATAGTVSSKAFERELKKQDPKVKIFQQACPMLVPLVEEGEWGSLAARMFIKKYLRPLCDEKIDTVILGCTHYGILENDIREIAGRGVRVVSEGKVVAKKLKEYLEKHPEIENRIGRRSKIIFYTTDLTDKFIRLGSRFFGRKIKPDKINLE